MKVPKEIRHRVKSWSERPGVIGVFWGKRRKNGRWLRRYGISVHVRKKLERHKVDPKYLFPKTVLGHPVSVLEVGKPRAMLLDHTNPVEIPAIGADSRSTITALCSLGNTVYALGSGHALLPTGMFDYDPASDPQVSIQAFDSGAQIRFDGDLMQGAFGNGSRLDYALVQFPGITSNQVDVTHRAFQNWPGLPMPCLTGLPRQEARLVQFSRIRMQRVYGSYVQIAVSDTEIAIPGKGSTTFSKVLMINSETDNFGEPGDSGSLVLTDSDQVVGVLIGRDHSARLAYALPINPIISALDARARWFFQ